MSKQYKVVVCILKTNVGIFAGSDEQIIKIHEVEIQKRLDEYARMGWRLVSTNLQGEGSGHLKMLVHLYFEKDA